MQKFHHFTHHLQNYVSIFEDHFISDAKRQVQEYMEMSDVRIEKLKY